MVLTQAHCMSPLGRAYISTVVPVDLTHKFGRQARAAAAATTPRPLKNKVYVTFQTNEGDTPKIVAGLFGTSPACFDNRGLLRTGSLLTSSVAVG